MPLVVREHIIFGKQLGNYLGSYVGPRALEPRLNEAIMNTMNSVNTCPYCTGLHGELGRMAGINSYAIVEGAVMSPQPMNIGGEYRKRRPLVARLPTTCDQVFRMSWPTREALVGRRYFITMSGWGFCRKIAC